MGVSLCAGMLLKAEVQFTHFSICNPLPGTNWGTAGIPLADLDGDGDWDCALSRRDAHGFWWYERRSDAVWVPHLINDSAALPQGLGAAAVDVDDDGWTDLVFSSVWFKNPGTLRQNPDSPWVVNAFGGSGHDLLGADVNGDGRDDLVVFDGNTLAWFDSAQGLASNLVAQGVGHHGGVAPRGVGDLDGDGDLDLVIAGKWYANPGTGVGAWAAHPWPHLEIPNASYGTSIRSWVVDLDGDGDQDIVYSDCDTGYSHVYWVRNDGGGTHWTRYGLTDPPTSPGSVEGTGSFHSLAVADFDGDGDLDIFAGEQEDPDTYMVAQGKLPMKPRGLKERGVIWVNQGGTPPLFEPRVIQEDNPGWHDACVGDVDGDGDPDLVSKIWNKDGPTYHADFWRNDSVWIRLDTGTNLSGWHATGGLWTVENGAIVGQQLPPGSGNGGLLCTDQSFGDFEAIFEVWPDWGVDTGFFTRTDASGRAYQVTIDYQPNNPMGGIYLEGIGNQGFWDFTLTGTNSIQGNPACFNASNWPAIWNPAGWNTFRVQVTNNPPHIITWINGVKIKDYQDSQVRLAPTGRIALQVHSTVAEWPAGAVARFRNIRIRNLSASFSSPDIQAPAVPAGLQVSGTTPRSVSLRWTPATDDTGVAGYRIYRDQLEVGTSAALAFLDFGLVPETTYRYTVRAFDAAGNHSPMSLPVHATTPAATLPTPDLAFRVRADAGVTLNGGAVSQWADQSGHQRHASQGTAASQPTWVPNALNGKPVVRFDGVNDFLNFTLPINGWTGMTMVLVSANHASRDPGVNQGNYAPLFWDETVSWGWTYLSPFQTNVVMRFGTTQTGNLIKYNRPASLGGSYTLTVGIHDGTTDRLYVDGRLVMSVPGKLPAINGSVNAAYLGRGAASTFFPGDLAEVLIFSRALSDVERVALENELRRAYLPAQLPAVQITNPPNGAMFFTPARITVAASASDSDGISQVRFFANTAFLGVATDPPYAVVWDLAEPGEYFLTARAVDALGAEAVSEPVRVMVSAPETRPAAPTGLVAVAAPPCQIRLRWTDPATNETGYRVERRPAAEGGYLGIAMLDRDASFFTDTNLTAGSSYAYRVVATNAAGESSASNEATATAPPLLSPPGLLPVAGQSVIAGTTLWVTNRAFDPNVPPQSLRFSLASAPADAAMDPIQGLLSWRPPREMAGTSNLFTVVVTQEGWHTQVPCEADAYVLDGYPNANYGTQPHLVVKQSATAGLSRESFLRFDLFEIPGWVDGAELRLHSSDAILPGIHAVAVAGNAWGETTLTWANKPASGPPLATWTPRAGEVTAVPLTAAARGALETDGRLSVRVYATQTTADGLVYYTAREGEPVQAPRLQVVTGGGAGLSATQSFWVVVLPPPPLALHAPGLDPAGRFSFLLAGAAGPDYEVQTSSNLLDWVTLCTTRPPTLPFLFVDPAPATQCCRFYRARLEP